MKAHVVCAILVVVEWCAACTGQAAEGGVPSSLRKRERASLHVWRQTAIANKFFAHNLFSAVARATDTARNFLVSPYAVSAGLATTLLGARGNTARQLIAALEYGHIETDPDGVRQDTRKIARLYAKLRDQLISRDHGFELQAPNCLFGDAGERYLPAFVDGVARYYGADFKRVDFRHDSTGARQTINAWVAEATNNTISDAIAPNMVSPVTRLVLVSTLYFKGDWEKPFHTTRPGQFVTSGGESVPTTYMIGDFVLNYADSFSDCEGCLNAKYIEIPYKSTSSKYQVVMELILPNVNDAGALYQLESKLDEDTLYYTTEQKELTSVRVILPKFQLEHGVDLREVLESMGLRDLFDPTVADLSGINGERNLRLQSAQHKTFIQVDETGTRAAASFAQAQNRAATEVFFDHPFLLVVRETHTKLPLFMGRVARP